MRVWLIETLVDRDGQVCGWCKKLIDLGNTERQGREYPSIDHIISTSKGGQDDLDNLRLLHQGCNNLRGRDGDRRLELNKPKRALRDRHEGMDVDNYLIHIRIKLDLPVHSSELDILKAATDYIYTEAGAQKAEIKHWRSNHNDVTNQYRRLQEKYGDQFRLNMTLEAQINELQHEHAVLLTKIQEYMKGRE